MTRMQRLGLRKPPVVEAATWDWRERDYHLVPGPGGLTATVCYWTDGGWGSPQFAGQNPNVGDYVILRTKAEHGTRYRITSIEAPSPTCEIRHAELEFAPRTHQREEGTRS